MTQDMNRYERSIFRRFVGVANLLVNPRSVRSCKPPRPDISCRFDGIPHYFELTRMVHAGSANAMGRHLAQLVNGTAPLLEGDCYDDRAALRETIKRKGGKSHETGSRPMGFLIYIDGVYHPPGMPSAWARAILEEEGPKRQWKGIWLYDLAFNRIVASWQRK